MFETVSNGSCLGRRSSPNERHSALQQMLSGKAAAEDEVTGGFLKFGGVGFWDVVVKVCREQWLLLTEAAPGAKVVWPEEWCVGVLVHVWTCRGNKRRTKQMTECHEVFLVSD